MASKKRNIEIKQTITLKEEDRIPKTKRVCHNVDVYLPITYRLTKKEKSLIRKRAADAGISMSEYSRISCLGYCPKKYRVAETGEIRLINLTTSEQTELRAWVKNIAKTTDLISSLYALIRQHYKVNTYQQITTEQMQDLFNQTVIFRQDLRGNIDAEFV